MGNVNSVAPVDTGVAAGGAGLPCGTSAGSSRTPYPAFSTAAFRSRGVTSAGSYATLAFSVARFTPASRTPSTFDRPFSTRRTQLAQVIPVIGSDTSRTVPAACGVLSVVFCSVVICGFLRSHTLWVGV